LASQRWGGFAESVVDRDFPLRSLNTLTVMTHRWLCVLALACSLTYSQTAEPAFEVASVSYVGPYDSERGMFQRGGPGTSDPTRITYENVTTLILLVRAY
jgi:hypothetical protein